MGACRLGSTVFPNPCSSAGSWESRRSGSRLLAADLLRKVTGAKVVVLVVSATPSALTGLDVRRPKRASAFFFELPLQRLLEQPRFLSWSWPSNQGQRPRVQALVLL